MKIIGNPVGTTLPKPNLMQTDPTQGDYIKGKDEFVKQFGGVQFETDNTLKITDGVLSVNTTNDVEQDNTLPITSAAIYVTVGNIETLLKTI
jgi:hypothetical protein